MGEELVLTEFNSNKATLIRIDSALRAASDCSVTDDFHNWFKALMVLRREAFPKMDETQQKKSTAWYRKIEKNLAILHRSGQQDYYNTKIDNDLDEFELFLREIMDKKGMLLKDGENQAFNALR